MGINGLRTYLYERLRARQREKQNLSPKDDDDEEDSGDDWQVLPDNATLVVDSSSFMFYVLNSIDRVKFALYGGQYELLDRAIESEIAQLRNVMGLNLIFVEDGAVSKLKAATMSKRLAAKEAEWEALWNLCQHQSSVLSTSEQVKLPVPPLTTHQLRQTLSRLGVESIRAPGEADQAVAQMCREGNARLEKPRFFSYAYDSDYFVMADCPYIELGHLRKLSSGVVAAKRIWTRVECADLLNLTEAQLVEAALLAGNDYTDPFERSTLHDLRLNEQPDFSDACAIVGDIPVTFRLSSDDAAYEEALQYSRLFYDDGDDKTRMSVEQTGDFVNHATGESVVPDSRSRQLHSLSKKQREALLAWGETLSSIQQDTSIGSFALDFLQDQLKAWEHDTRAAAPLFDDINADHLATLREMLGQLSSPNLDVTVDVTSAMGNPAWPDVLAANLYQMICAFIYWMSRDKAMVAPIRPWHEFNGPLFHSLMRLRTIRELEDDRDGKLLEEEDFLFSPMKQPTVHEERLPIEDHRDIILETVRLNQVTIIHGETGCGKSTKLPVYLYEEAKRRGEPCKMMLSQPRRIATHSLMKRLRGVLGDVIGMRMGNNTRDETKETRIWLVTTGYLVQLFAASPEYLDKMGFTHLLIDEVHERKLDSDILVFLAKRLISRAPHIRLILMSATANFELYSTYFASLGQHPATLSVGVKRFPIEQLYLEDIERLADSQRPRVPVPSKIVDMVANEFIGHKAFTPSGELLKRQVPLVRFLVRMLAEPNKAILVFVSGMQAITDLFDAFEEDKHRLALFAIHSELPFEEQTAIFAPLEDPTMTKIVIATNAAESSITLPDVDLVICLGTEKAMTYDAERHGRRLAETFISKSSAIQRAGRTGRVRPGRVIRIYPRHQFEVNMQDFEAAEVLRTPLDDSILQLRASFERSTDFEGVIPLLQELIQVPDLSNIQRSFVMLFQNQMINSPNDLGMLTELGRMASLLPVDSQSCRLIAQGICLGLGAEAVVLASAITQPKTIFRTASRLVHTDPEELHEIARAVLLSAMRLDGEVHSEPIMMLQLYKVWHHIPPEKRGPFMFHMAMAGSRVSHFIHSTDHLLQAVQAKNLKLDLDRIHSKEYLELSQETINRLRLLLLWNSNGALATLHPVHLFHRKRIEVNIPDSSKDPSARLTRAMIENDLLPADLEWRGRKLEWTLNSAPVELKGCDLRKDLVGLSTTEMLKEILFRFRKTGLPSCFAILNKFIGIGNESPSLVVACNVAEALADKFEAAFLLSTAATADDDDFDDAKILRRWRKDMGSIKAKEGVSRDHEMEMLMMGIGGNPSQEQSPMTKEYAVFRLEGGKKVPKTTWKRVAEFAKSISDSCLLLLVEQSGQAQITMTNLIPPELGDLYELSRGRTVHRSALGTTLTVTPPFETIGAPFEFEDCPLDYKLLMTYKQMERRNKGVVRMKHPAKEGGFLDVFLSLDVPSWRAVGLINQFRRPGPEEDGDDDSDDAYGLEMDSMFPFGLDPKNMVVLETNSVPSATVHLSAPLFAVGARMTLCGHRMSRFECTTLLPPGTTWLRKALRCTGWSMIGGSSSMSKDVEALCIRIHDLLHHAVLQKIEPNEELITSVGSAFTDVEALQFARGLDAMVTQFASGRNRRHARQKGAANGEEDQEADALGEEDDTAMKATPLKTPVATQATTTIKGTGTKMPGKSLKPRALELVSTPQPTPVHPIPAEAKANRPVSVVAPKGVSASVVLRSGYIKLVSSSSANRQPSTGDANPCLAADSEVESLAAKFSGLAMAVADTPKQKKAVPAALSGTAVESINVPTAKKKALRAAKVAATLPGARARDVDSTKLAVASTPIAPTTKGTVEVPSRGGGGSIPVQTPLKAKHVISKLVPSSALLAAPDSGHGLVTPPAPAVSRDKSAHTKGKAMAPTPNTGSSSTPRPAATPPLWAQSGNSGGGEEPREQQSVKHPVTATSSSKSKKKKKKQANPGAPQSVGAVAAGPAVKQKKTKPKGTQQLPVKNKGATPTKADDLLAPPSFIASWKTALQARKPTTPQLHTAFEHHMATSAPVTPFQVKSAQATTSPRDLWVDDLD